MPIDIEKLNAVTTVVAHADCPDGIASALICRDALGLDVQIKFVQHCTPSLLHLGAWPGMLFVDITPPRERVEQFIDVGALVLDHHGTQRDIVERFAIAGLGVFADEKAEPGVSGAVLAYREVWCPLNEGIGDETVRRFADLAGIRDTWQRSSPHWERACAQAAALRFWPFHDLTDRSVRHLDDMLTIGPVLRQKDRERDDKSIAEAVRWDIGMGSDHGLRVLAFDGTWTSDIADRMAGEVDLVIGWHYAVVGARLKLIVSLRSRGTFSSAALAKRHGGGGHTGAAGFTIDAPTTAPHIALHELVREHIVLTERGL